jgi:hypothetical protein
MTENFESNENSFIENKTKEDNNPDLLSKINTTLAKLGSTAKWIKTPEFRAEYKPLQDKKIILVDDSVAVLENQMPKLMVATNGKALFVLYKGEPIEELIKQILSQNADIILMDYTLSEEINGSMAIDLLRQEGFTGKIIGYSSSKDSNMEMVKHGAVGTVDKFKMDSVRLLGELIKDL